MISSPDDQLTSQLDPGERLLWSGQPRQGLRLRLHDLFLIPFSLMWCGFAIFWEASVFRTGAPLFFRLWGIPFVCVGLFFVFGRFFFDARTRARTLYGVTGERILIVSGLFSLQVKSLPLRTLSDVSLTQRGDGSGTITFGPAVLMSNVFAGSGWPGAGRNSPPAFEQIEGVRAVYDLIRNAQKGLS